MRSLSPESRSKLVAAKEHLLARKSTHASVLDAIRTISPHTLFAVYDDDASPPIEVALAWIVNPPSGGLEPRRKVLMFVIVSLMLDCPHARDPAEASDTCDRLFDAIGALCCFASPTPGPAEPNVRGVRCV